MAQVVTPPGNGMHYAHDSAHSVGSPADAVKIRELEDQVNVLAEKANNASQKFADYENEIRVLQAKVRQYERKEARAAQDDSSSGESVPTTLSERPSVGLTRGFSFMGSRKPVPALSTSGLSGGKERELESALIKERTERIALEGRANEAEKKVKETNAEIEDLSATLFQQANEMVATERKENAALKEKIRALERQVAQPEQDGSLQRENAKLKERLKALEARDAERKRRLEKLEAASRSIERARALLIPR